LPLCPIIAGRPLPGQRGLPPAACLATAHGRDDLPRVGGKGANLAILARAGITVPPGFCVTTRAFELFLASLLDAEARFGDLDRLDGTSVDAARAAAESMRAALDRLAVPDEVERAVTAAWKALGTEHPLAVRSSATAEDLPGASFAGQQDTYLNVRDQAALLDAVRRCWISLFTDRAVKLHFSYQRFLENQIRQAFGFVGTPIWIKNRARG